MSWLSFITPLELTKVNSPLNGEIKVVESFGQRTLLVNNDVEQSGGTVTVMWDKAIKRIENYTCLPAGQELRIKNCLVLGLGGGTVIRLLEKQYPTLNITAIEFDPVMIEVAQKYFGIKASPKLKIIKADAFSWIKTAEKKYDLIIFDLYLGKFNPRKSRELSFLKSIKNLLLPSGFILYNAHYQNDEKNYQELLKTVKDEFLEVRLLLTCLYSRILYLGN